mgnify:CR=1 FL=1
MGVKRSIWFKSLATFLAFIIVIQLLPLSVLAENITQSSASDISNEQNMEVVGEVVDKRTEYQKTYELTDGTYYEITSSLPIHEKQEVNGLNLTYQKMSLRPRRRRRIMLKIYPKTYLKAPMMNMVLPRQVLILMNLKLLVLHQFHFGLLGTMHLYLITS